MKSHSSPRNLTYWQMIWKQFCRHRLGFFGLIIVLVFFFMAIYAPFFASSRPIVVQYGGQWYFPLFRYLFYPGFYSKHLDIFYNLLIFTFPLLVMTWICLKSFPRFRFWAIGGEIIFHFLLFIFLILFPPRNPEMNTSFDRQYQQQLQAHLKSLQTTPFYASPLSFNWQSELQTLNSYARLNRVLRYQRYQEQHEHLKKYEQDYEEQVRRRGQKDIFFPTLWNLAFHHELKEKEAHKVIIDELKTEYSQAKLLINSIQKPCQVSQRSFFASFPPWMLCDFFQKLLGHDRKSFVQAKNTVDRYEKAEAEWKYSEDRSAWLEEQAKKIRWKIMPLFRSFHWEEDAGGDQSLNLLIPWWDLTRINRKDMVSALIFGIRVSFSVGFLSIAIALVIGIPIGAIAGYYGGKLDLILYRLIEIWESMPTFFMLLMVVAFLQSKSIFLIITVIGIFGWTRFSRFLRGEFFRQKQLLYVEACHALGYPDSRIIFSHLLPNAIPPLLTLIPFAIMGAMTSEAGLSFLGLGEEGSNSWGVLMDEGRTAFPSESYLLWPPAILLTILLVAVALVGDSLRDALDPKLHIGE